MTRFRFASKKVYTRDARYAATDWNKYDVSSIVLNNDPPVIIRAQANALGRNVYVNYDILRIVSCSRADHWTHSLHERTFSEIIKTDKRKKRSLQIHTLAAVCGSRACKYNHVWKLKSYFPSASAMTKNAVSSIRNTNILSNSSNTNMLCNLLSITTIVFVVASLSFFRKYDFVAIKEKLLPWTVARIHR